MFELAIKNETFHLLEHLSFLGAGLIFWWPLLQATSSISRRPLNEPQKLVFLFFGSLPMMAIALPLQFVTVVLYDVYMDAPRVNGFLTPVVDQTVAGALMMFLDMVAMTTDGLVVFFRWIRREQSLDRARSAQPLEEEGDAEEAAALDAYLETVQRRSGPLRDGENGPRQRPRE